MKNLKELIRKAIVFIITLEAKAIVRKYRPKIVVVTGSVGKTSAKDAVYAALSTNFFVRRSEKSFNSDIGVPLTVLGVPNGWANPVTWLKNSIEGLALIILPNRYPEWLVVEVGADRPGDISRSLSWLSPAIVVATRFPDVPVHVEFYKDPEAVVREELAPVSWLSEEGTLVANADDVRASTAQTNAGTRILYGFGKDAMLKGSKFHTNSRNNVPSGISFDVSYGEERVHIALPGVAGRQHTYAILAGLAVAVGVGVPLEQAAQAFEKHDPPHGRMHLIPGIKGSVIIDDSYNASPIATEEGLQALADIPHAGRRIAVLADMLELGSFSVQEHRRIGGVATPSSDMLVTAGVRARDIAYGAREAGMNAEMVHECEKGEDAATYLKEIVAAGDVLLIKGSQSTRMEKVVKALMAEPEKAQELLVRQDTEWSKR